MGENDSGPRERLSRSERINISISVTQTVLAIVGIFIGSVALYAALSESEEVRKQTEASVWPRIAIGHNRSESPGEELIEFVVSNYGIGPGIVKGAQVTIDGAAQKTWFDVIQVATGRQSPPISNSEFARAVIPAGEDIVALHVEGEVAAALNSLLRKGSISVEVCYCSVFDQCWVARYTEAEATPVGVCPNYGDEEFRQ